MQLEPIAIIGIGCRFPGAENPQAFWELIKDGRDEVSEVPKSRWDVDKFYDSDRSSPGKANTRWGGFLDNIDRFDPQFFGIAPKEAVTMDPQQRLLLEVAWETLEDAHYIPQNLRGSNTGVFIGIGTHDYSIMMWQQPVSEPYATTGTGNCIAANRISYTFDLKGPSLAVDTACSSSLVAVHLACQSIWTGESNQALAGGVNVLLLPTIMVGFSKGGFMSSEGRCKSFDAGADGYVRGEGAGLVLLKPLSQAQKDGDNIYGVILSSAVNQDGCSNGLAAPNPEAQEAVLRSAYHRGGIDPSQVSYVEAHGTGTKIGDPIEIKALEAVLGQNRPSEDYCLVGSVKTNIGHTETAAGIAGIIKVALALQNKQIPPNLHFNQPNSAIAKKLRVVTKLTPWETDKPLIAGVNSFGFGGTNAHIVMGEAEVQRERIYSESQNIIPQVCNAEKINRQECKKIADEYIAPCLLTLSAKSKAALQELAQKYLNFIQHTDASLSDICYTANTKRSQFNYRLSCVSASIQQLEKQLNAFVSGKKAVGLNADIDCININKQPQICWLFTGQGSQYVGMGKKLYDIYPVFRKSLDRCADILKSYINQPLKEIIHNCKLNGKQTDIDINRTVYTQPAIFSLEYALAQLWLSWGVKPDRVMGHSIGEYVAATVAGIFSLEDALLLVSARGKLMDDLPSSGGMLAVFSSQEKVTELIASNNQKVTIAAVNNEKNTVVAGDKEALEILQKKLEEININSTFLEVSQGFHSPLMNPILKDFAAVAESIKYSVPQIPLISNVTGSLADENIATASYWIDHVIQPVNFAESFQFLLQQNINTFLEIGAKPILCSLGKVIVNKLNNSVLLLPSLSDKKSDLKTILDSVASLYNQGIKINWQSFYKEHFCSTVKLPTYPFQRQKYWWDKAKFWEQENKYNHQKTLHPLLGNYIDSSESSKICFQNKISAINPQYLKDHCLENKVVFPATGYIEIVLAAAKEFSQNDKLEIEIVIKKPLLLSKEITTIQTVIIQDNKINSVKIYSKADSENNNDWILHCEAIFKVNDIKVIDIVNLEATKLHLSESNINEQYQKLSQQGLNYGKCFQGIKKLWRGNNRSLGFIEIPDNILSNQDLLHPALLDSCLQLISAATDFKGVYLPVSIESLQLLQQVNNTAWAEIVINDVDNKHISADIKITNEKGKVAAIINNLTLKYLNQLSLHKLIDFQTEKDNNLEDSLYKVTWQQKKLSKESENISLPNNWLIISQYKDVAFELEKKLSGKKVLVFLDKEFIKLEDRQYKVNPTQPEDFNQLWQEIYQQNSSWKIIYVDAPQESAIESHIQGCAAILHLMQSINNPSHLFTVTQNTQLTNNNISGAWGLIKTINLEYPDLNCICLDIEKTDIDNQVATILTEIKYSNIETQIAYQDNQRYVARLTPQDKASTPNLKNPFRLQLSDFGTLDNLTLAPLQRRPPLSGEIEVAVKASGVNFRDVLNALGVLKEYLQLMGFTEANQVPFGGECAGVIVAVGDGVTEFKIGDEVVVAQAVGSLSSHVTIDARFAIALPQDITYTEAATIPTTFLTAYYGLHYLAKIKPGDKVLIHAAAGGVGQAAVQLAQLIGAEVFATASVGKWDFLKASGVKYVMNSRTLDFAEEVMQFTQGKGVDVILNSLNGDFIPKNLDILAPQGKFIEIGKVGIWNREEVKAKRSDVSYYPFDLLEVSQQKPDLIKTLFTQLQQKFIHKQLQPLPHKVFPIDKADKAFRYMAQAKHIGKVVISLPNTDEIIKQDACYLITGGLGSLGLQVATLLVAEGATHLVLIGRNQPSGLAKETIKELQASGVTIETKLVDISDYSSVEQTIKQLSAPLKGIIHAAGMLDDGLLKNLSWQRFKTVLQPKIAGSWNLHLATQKLNLDWFVCFSSVVSVFGSVGQSNYAAANAFMDNLMSYRRNLGLPGTSINWSIWDEVGMASRLSTQQQQRLTQQGIKAIALQEGLQTLKQILQQPAQQTIVFPVDWQTFLNQHPIDPFFEQLQPKSIAPIPPSSFLHQLIQAPEARRYQLLQEHIREQIAKVLGFPDPEEIDNSEKFADLGMDSLMAVEFQNSLQASLSDEVSLTTAFDYPSVELLSNYIAQELFTEDFITQFDNSENKKPQPSAKSNNTLEKPVKQIESTPIKRSQVNIKPEFSQFKLTPEYLNLKKDLERVEKLGNPFFSLHQGIAKDTISTGNRELINYSSYNYLGMSGDRIITEATQKAISEYGTSVSASRLLSGERPIHLELEREIADFIGTEDAIMYVGGHATNVSTIGHLFNEKDLIICDSLSHNSIKEGCKLSGSRIIDFPHNDYHALEAILERERGQYQKVLIAVEGIYSTDGDLAPLPQIVELKKHYQTWLLVDEAHSIGVLGVSGGGVREHFNLQPTDVDLWMGTLSKSFASCGGYIAGSKELIQYLKYTAPGFVFSVGMSPANTASALAALRLLKAEPERAIKLHSRAKFCLDLAKSKGFNTGYSAESPIIPIIVGEPNKAVRLSQILIQQGININPMVYPSVPYDAARLRFFITCLHTEEQILSTMNILEEAIANTPVFG